jgi:hypothetical protein
MLILTRLATFILALLSSILALFSSVFCTQWVESQSKSPKLGRGLFWNILNYFGNVLDNLDNIWISGIFWNILEFF